MFRSYSNTSEYFLRGLQTNNKLLIDSKKRNQRHSSLSTSTQLDRLNFVRLQMMKLVVRMHLSITSARVHVARRPIVNKLCGRAEFELSVAELNYSTVNFICILACHRKHIEQNKHRIPDAIYIFFYFLIFARRTMNSLLTQYDGVNLHQICIN